jgi:hypothetical protein
MLSRSIPPILIVLCLVLVLDQRQLPGTAHRRPIFLVLADPRGLVLSLRAVVFLEQGQYHVQRDVTVEMQSPSEKRERGHRL